MHRSQREQPAPHRTAPHRTAAGRCKRHDETQQRHSARCLGSPVSWRVRCLPAFETAATSASTHAMMPGVGISLVLAVLVAPASSSSGAVPLPPLAPRANLTLDLGAAPRPFPHYWTRSFGSGHALMGTRADWQTHLQLAVDELGLRGLRMHGVLDDDMSVVTDKGTYSWYNIDRVYDHMLSLGVRPVVELSFMPRHLANCSDCPQQSGNPRQCFYAFDLAGSYKGLTQPPQDYNDWYLLVRALAAHLVERHGVAEVSQWHFE